MGESDSQYAICDILPFIGLIAHTPTPTPLGGMRSAYWASREPKHLHLIMPRPAGGGIDGSLLATHYHAGLRHPLGLASPRNVIRLPAIFQDRSFRLTVVRMQRFRPTKNVGFQDHRNLGAYNQHPSLRHSIPPASHQPVTRLGAWVLVLRWWLSVPRGSDFHQLARMNLSRHSRVIRLNASIRDKINTKGWLRRCCAFTNGNELRELHEFGWVFGISRCSDQNPEDL
jgi:hypothetical protein